MAEFDAEIRCFLSDGLNPVQVAQRLCIPLQWVIDYENDEILGRLEPLAGAEQFAGELDYLDVHAFAEQFADADAIAFGQW